MAFCIKPCIRGDKSQSSSSNKIAEGRRKVVILGGGFAGLRAARELRNRFDVVLIDAKEYFEFTPAILRVYANPDQFELSSFLYADILEKKMGVRFLWGEVLSIDGPANTLKVKPMSSPNMEDIIFDHCIIATGCNFDMEDKWGESLWFPTVHGKIVHSSDSQWHNFDERYRDGRRRHIRAEHARLQELHERKGSVLVRGAGFIGVEWAAELKHFFPDLDVAIVEFMPNCLGPHPKKAQDYCNKYLEEKGIRTIYSYKYQSNNQVSWEKIGMPKGPDKVYHCLGVKACNYFMPPETLSDRGPGNGGWILMNGMLQVTTKQGHAYGNGNIYTVGDCNYGSIGTQAEWKEGKGMPYIPKIAYPAEEQALHVARNISYWDAKEHGSIGFCLPIARETWWPWGAGTYAISLGPNDGCGVVGCPPSGGTQKGSGWMCLSGSVAVLQKELIESTKLTEQRHEGCCSRFLWYLIHHWRINFWGRGPFLV